jgi:hypothetical protein
MNRRDILLASTAAGLDLMLPARSLAQAGSTTEKIVDAWSLVSIYDEGADGAKHYVWGDGVQGMAIYTPGGHFSTEIIAANRDRKASKTPRTPVGQAIAYFGTYALDEKMILTLHIERCTFPGWDGVTRVAKITALSDGELKTENAVVHDPVIGDLIPKLVWKRTT